MEKLKQNNLEEATTELGFVQAINANAGETVVALEREVELENGEIVTVAGITPEKMKAILNNGADSEVVTFKTPGEKVGDLEGVCQVYNATLTDDPAEEEPVAVFATIVPGKKYKFTFRDVVDEEAGNITEKLESQQDFQILSENEDLMLGHGTGFICGCMDATAGAENVYYRSWVNADTFTPLDEMGIVGEFTGAGWKHIAPDATGEQMTIADSVAPGPFVMTVGTIDTIDGDLESFDTATMSWLFASVEEVTE